MGDRPRWRYKLTDKFGNVYRGTASELSRELYVSVGALSAAYSRGGTCAGCKVERYPYREDSLFEEVEDA